MKKLFFGLLVAGVAFGGSAFTNTKVSGSAYIQSKSGSPGSYVYTYSQTELTCESTGDPCFVTGNLFNFGTSGTITQAQINNPAQVTIQSTQAGL